MTPKERECLKRLDDLILHASPEKLKKIQSIDYKTQLEGLPFYDIYLDSSSLVSQSITKSFRRS